MKKQMRELLEHSYEGNKVIAYIEKLEKELENNVLAKELVDKATPKKPDYEGDGFDRDGNIIYDTWICPCCEERYEVDYHDYKYCPNCGQKLDWEE